MEEKIITRPPISEVKEALINALNSGYSQLKSMSAEMNGFPESAIESLFSVVIAQTLLEWKSDNKEWDKYSIQLEQSAEDFKNKAFETYRFYNKNQDDIFSGSSIINRKYHLPVRTGRIDVTVSERLPSHSLERFRSFVGIETKAINPAWPEINSDMARLYDCLNATDQIGENNIQSCFICFLRRLDTPSKPMSLSQMSKSWERYQRELQDKILNEPQLKGIKYSIEKIDIDNYTSEQYSKSVPEDWQEYADAAENTGAIVGVVIQIFKLLKDE